jgi:hypothetical protein
MFRLLSPFEAIGKTCPVRPDADGRAGHENATSTVALFLGSLAGQCWVFAGLPALGGVMNEPTGTTTCFGFLGFFASLFPRNWPLAMVFLLANTSEVSNLAGAMRARPTQSDHRRLHGKFQLYIQRDDDEATSI